MTVLLISLLWITAGFLVLATLRPFTKMPHGIIQGLDFPREQFLFLSLTCMVLFSFAQPDVLHLSAAVVMAVVAIIHAAFIIKFTPFWSRQSVKADADLLATTDRHLSMLTVNVKISNRQYDRLVALIQDKSPDIVAAIDEEQRRDRDPIGGDWEKD